MKNMIGDNGCDNDNRCDNDLGNLLRNAFLVLNFSANLLNQMVMVMLYYQCIINALEIRH